MSLLADSYRTRFLSPLAAYNRLQAALMRRFVNRGGTSDQWIERLAPAFWKRYGWLCEEPVPVRVTNPRYYRHPHYRG